MALAALCLSQATVRGQSAKWILNSHVYDMTGANPSLASVPASVMSADNPCAAFSDAGNLLFYIANGRMYSSTNVDCGQLPVNQKTITGLINPTDDDYVVFANPAMIIPVPGTCTEYYVIYTLTLGANHLAGAYQTVYCKIDISSGNPTVDPTSVVPLLFGGNDTGIKNPKTLADITSFVISKGVDAANERYLFSVDNSSLKVKVKKWFISGTDIALSSTIYDGTGDATYPNATCSHGELELSPDQSHLAFFVNPNGSISTTQLLYQINLQNYAFSSMERKIFTPNYGYGLEYSKNSDKLFESRTNGTAPALVYVTVSNFSPAVFTNVATTGVNFNQSNLELGKSGNIYGVSSNGSQLYYYAINPDAPTAPTVTSTGLQQPNTNANFPIPLSVDGDSYVSFIGNTMPVSNFNINGFASGNTPPQFIDLYSCNALTLNNLSSTGYLPPLTLYYGLSYTVQSCDVNGNVITGAAYLNYSSDWRLSTSTVNLKSLPTGTVFSPGPAQTWLADPTHYGYYKIVVTVRNTCGATSSKISYIKLNAPTSPVSMNLQINQAGGAICYTHNILANCDQTGIYGLGFNLGTPGSTFASNNIDNYSRKIEEVDCGTGAVTSLLYEDATPQVPVSPSGSLIALNLNSAVINGSAGYFANHPADVLGKCYKLTVTVANACSSVSDYSFFKIAPNGYWKPGVSGENTTETFSIFPNPATDRLMVKYINLGGNPASITIFDLQGKMLLQNTNLSGNGTDMEERMIDISQLNKGMYMYRFNNGKEVKTGQITKL